MALLCRSSPQSWSSRGAGLGGVVAEIAAHLARFAHVPTKGAHSIETREHAALA